MKATISLLLKALKNPLRTGPGLAAISDAIIRAEEADGRKGDYEALVVQLSAIRDRLTFLENATKISRLPNHSEALAARRLG